MLSKPLNHEHEPAAEDSSGGLVRVRLDISYDGTGFSGWARQPDRRTVCGVLEESLSLVYRRPVRLTVAGRTDAGVHATGQVAHADLPEGAVERLVRRFARLLPDDVRITGAQRAHAEFDARFSALRRHYAYRVADAAYGADPLRRNDTLAWPRTLDIAAMNAAAAELLGEHDFAAYCKQREGATTVRELQRLHLDRGQDGVLVAGVSADAFCHSMVRSIVGALLAVGEGRRTTDWPGRLLGERSRSSAVTVAPAHGLTLVGVDYPPDDRLGERARVTRNVRGAPGT